MYSAILKALENKPMKYIGQHDDFYISIFFDKGKRIYISTDTLLMGVNNAEELTEEGISWIRANGGTFEQAKHEADYIQSKMEFDQEHDDYMAKMIEEQERKAQAFFLKLQKDERGE